MNQNWKNFLISRQAHFIDADTIKFDPCAETGEHCVYALAHLGVLTVAGSDATHFLQGQITCDINSISANQAGFGAFCNAKGRAITTFLLIKRHDAFALVLPVELLEIVQKKLQMYILRADVTLTDDSANYCLIGLSAPTQPEHLDLPTHNLETTYSGCIRLPSIAPRFLMIYEPKTAIDEWSRFTEEWGFQPQNSDYWRYLDILSGIPWLTKATSEAFVPQMFSLDKLGGISFNKGCYTGQEIIARTHYLGQSKRELYLAETASDEIPASGTGIIDAHEQAVGKVLQAQRISEHCKMLVVLPSSQSASTNLTLDNQARNIIRILAL